MGTCRRITADTSDVESVLNAVWLYDLQDNFFKKLQVVTVTLIQADICVERNKNTWFYM